MIPLLSFWESSLVCLRRTLIRVSAVPCAVVILGSKTNTTMTTERETSSIGIRKTGSHKKIPCCERIARSFCARRRVSVSVGGELNWMEGQMCLELLTNTIITVTCHVGGKRALATTTLHCPGSGKTQELQLSALTRSRHAST